MKHIFGGILYTVLFESMILSFLFSVSFAHTTDVLNKVMASVAGEIITQYDIFLAIQEQLRTEDVDVKNSNNKEKIERMQEMVLNDLINDILIMQEAKRYNVVVTSHDVDNEMRKIARQNNISLTALEKQIVLQGNSIEKFKQNLKDNLVRQQMIGSFVWRKIVIAPQEIEEFYKKDAEIFKTDFIISLSHAAFGSKEEAQEALNKIQTKNSNFTSFVKNKSDADLGEFHFSELAPSWQRILLSAKEGNTVGPLAVDKKYFLLFISKKEEGKILPLDDVYTKIENTIREARFAKQYAVFTDSLREKTDVIIYK
ncbi:MAG: SurA N-terminal domain-containing protein [Desulfovibrionaceae bacterium]